VAARHERGRHGRCGGRRGRVTPMQKAPCLLFLAARLDEDLVFANDCPCGIWTSAGGAPCLNPLPSLVMHLSGLVVTLQAAESISLGTRVHGRLHRRLARDEGTVLLSHPVR
jgi:hypothetical protein